MNARPIPFLRGVGYVASFPDYRLALEQVSGSLVAFVGRSNSGKSTLLSALCDHQGLARVSSRAGKTQMLNYFHVPAEREQPGFYLVDLPGYGYASVPQPVRRRLRRMVDEFLLHAEPLRCVVLVLDARRRIESEELGVLAHAREVGRHCIFARTKWDRLNSKEKRSARELWKQEGWSQISVPVSAPKRSGLRELLTGIRGAIES